MTTTPASPRPVTEDEIEAIIVAHDPHHTGMSQVANALRQQAAEIKRLRSAATPKA